MKQELKPCPFCLSKDVGIADFEWQKYSKYNYAVVLCRHCGGSTIRVDQESAVDAWNSRKTPFKDKNGRCIFSGDKVIKRLLNHGYGRNITGVVCDSENGYIIKDGDRIEGFDLKVYWSDGNCSGFCEYELEILD